MASAEAVWSSTTQLVVEMNHACLRCISVCIYATSPRRLLLAGIRSSLPCQLAVLSGDPPLERVFAINQPARLLGLETGMSRVQAESFPVVVLRRDRQQEDASFAELMSCAQQFSPRIEIIASPQEETCGATLVLDVSGSERLLGNARQIAKTVRQSVYAMGYEASVAAAHNADAAVLAARGIRA